MPGYLRRTSDDETEAPDVLAVVARRGREDGAPPQRETPEPKNLRCRRATRAEIKIYHAVDETCHTGVQRRGLHLPRHPCAVVWPQGAASPPRRARPRRGDDQGPHGRAEGRRGGVVQRRRSQEDELTSHKPLPSNNYLLGHITSNDRHLRPAPSTLRGRGTNCRLLPAAAAPRPRPELLLEARVRAALRPPILDDAERLAGGQGSAPDEIGGDGRAGPRHAGPAMNVRNFPRPPRFIQESCDLRKRVRERCVLVVAADDVQVMRHERRQRARRIRGYHGTHSTDLVLPKHAAVVVEGGPAAYV